MVTFSKVFNDLCLVFLPCYYILGSFCFLWIWFCKVVEVVQNPRQSWLVTTIINTEILSQCLHFLKPYLANADRLLIERCYITTLIDNETRNLDFAQDYISRTFYVIVCNTWFYDLFFPDIYPVWLTNEFVMSSSATLSSKQNFYFQIWETFKTSLVNC